MKSVLFSELNAMSPDERSLCLEELFQAALNPTEQETKEYETSLDAKIYAFEEKYNISSQNLKTGIEAGSIQETQDFCSWLMLLQIKTRHA